MLNWEPSLEAQPGGECRLERARFDLDISIQFVYSATPAAPKPTPLWRFAPCHTR